MRSSSASNISPYPKILTDCNLANDSLSDMNRELSFHEKPKNAAFSIDKISSVCIQPNPKKAFKMLKFDEEKPNTPIHRRQPSLIIKKVHQSYDFNKNPKINQKKSSISSSNSLYINDQNFSIGEDLSIKNGKVHRRLTNLSKNSMFASTIEPKSSLCNSEIRNSSLFASEIDENKEMHNQDTELTEYINPLLYTKAEGNATTIVMPTQEFDTNESRFFQNNEFIYENNLINEKLGILPTRIYCKYCELETSTLVSLEMPTLPFWKIMCCIGDFIKCCSNLSSWEKYQKIHHRCKRCRKIIGKCEPEQI